MSTPTDDPLARERSHLASSRSALRAMREDAESLDIRDVTANWVNAEVLARQIDDRIKALADLSDTPLFFGRLTYLHAPGAEQAEGAEGEQFYIGRRHVHDADGDPMVIDWRAPVSQPFYRASKKDPLDVSLRRRFGYTGGDLTAYEDEHLMDPAEAAATSRLLQQEIERPRVGPMRDIVATIQPEQDEIVRSGLGGTVCVQGGPGTGKTAVGLHRVAYLLYAHRERLARTGTLVIGPNKSFLHYIEQVLPALGELTVRQGTVDDLVAHVEVSGTDEAPAAVIKGDARMAEVLRRAVYSHVTLPTEPVMVVRGSRRWRVPAYELESIVRELLDRDIRYGAAREALPQRIAHAVLVQMERSGGAGRPGAGRGGPQHRGEGGRQGGVAAGRAREARAAAAHRRGLPRRARGRHPRRGGAEDDPLGAAWIWKTGGAERQGRQVGCRGRGVDRRGDRPRAADALARACGARRGAGPLPMQYRAVGRRCTTGSATVLGDLAQGTTPWATRSWDEALAHLGKSEGVIEELTAGFRVPTDVITYASRLLPHIAPGLTPVASVRENPGFFDLRETGGTDEVVAACEELLRNEGSTGLIAADARIPALADALTAAGIGYIDPGEETTADTRLTLVPASLAKGLEYDYVVLDEPQAVVDGEPDERTGLRRLYVALTRAVSGLIVTHTAPLPAQLA